MASAESQKLADEHEPVGSSRYFRGGAVEQELKGKKLSLVTWENHHNIESWMTKVFKAYGFPSRTKLKLASSDGRAEHPASARPCRDACC
jgi:hypothetical protein